MKEFASIKQMIAHLAKMAAAEETTAQLALKKCAVGIEVIAKLEIGIYQDSVGPFARWEDLAESTKRDRIANGFSPDRPLLRTGELRDSISHEISGMEAVIGSDSEIMAYQELGTNRIPPRAVLGPAAIHAEKLIIKVVGSAIAEGLLIGSGVKLPKL